MKRLFAIHLLAFALTGPTAALATSGNAPDPSPAAREAGTNNRIVISVSGRQGGSVAAYARWHFAQDGKGEGKRRFARD
ncbi:hypothetical protein [Ovoidimarina sediminis]|uniref:hypothetical protein n=1 Tax=Ovoidimarina sediminis TaxID=3079856 RepID=UPI002910AFE2|nr:hypothetical protein [Rhodophyticola sp. MJ-SS7]MDU8944545.1 hypothetical protein [Rhodophyticola sp. MJ-SS7]